MHGQNGLHLGKFEKRRPTFFQIYISLHQNLIHTLGAGKSFSFSFSSRDFAHERAPLKGLSHG